MAFPKALPPIQATKTNQNTVSKIAGINNRDFEQLLKNAIIKLVGYWQSGIGEITKCPGLDTQYKITTGVDAGKNANVYKKWFPGYRVIGYGKHLQVRDTYTNTLIDVKDDFKADLTDGRKYGGYFYVADGNEGDKVGYLKATLNYETQTANFTVGKILTGATSSARAIILADSDSGATGTLTLNILSGSFLDNEPITDNAIGSALVDGTLAVTWTEIADAPACEVLDIINGNRLGGGNTDSDVSSVHVSRADQLSGVPFTAAADWTVGTLPDSPFINSYSDGGEVRALGRLGNQSVVLLDDGKFGFRIEQVDVYNIGLALNTPIDFQKIDFGGARGAVSTSIGVIYVNEAGVWVLSSGGITNVPYSAQDERISKPLGRTFTKNYSFDNADIVVDDDKEIVLIACRENSDINNKVLVYHLSKDLSGWSVWDKNISRWLKEGKDVFCTASGETTVYKLDYDLGADNDLEIPTEIVVEFNSGNVEGLVSPKEVSIAGKLESGSVIELSIDVLDRFWDFSSRIPLNGNGDTSYTFTTSGVGAKLPAVGSGGVGSAAVGGRGVGDGTNFIYSRGQRKLGMSEYMRVRLRAESFDKYQHVINLMSLFLESRGQAQTSNLT